MVYYSSMYEIEHRALLTEEEVKEFSAKVRSEQKKI